MIFFKKPLLEQSENLKIVKTDDFFQIDLNSTDFRSIMLRFSSRPAGETAVDQIPIIREEKVVHGSIQRSLSEKRKGYEDQ
jgi:hypothetical protein